MQRQQRSAKTFQYRLGLLCLCWLALSITATAQSWPQWGGPQRNFMVDAKGLSETWPASGPKKLWSRELGEGHSSIIADGDRLYTMYSKGAREFVVALDRATGKTIWEVDWQDQVVMAFADDVVGLDPNNGELLWRHPHRCGGFNITPPVWGADNILVISSAYECGSRALQLRQAGGKTTVKELWASNRMRVHHGTIIRLGDLVLGSSGTSGPAPISAVDVKTGKVIWQDRSFPKANLVFADGKLILLDEDGQLALVRLSPQGMTVTAKAAVLESIAWTPPTLVGANLYLRDRRTIMALDLR
jgi:outer membrane protein assembly factor BamB